MRELTSHQTNACNEQIEITVADPPGAGGASHHYVISWPDGGVELRFQNGPIAEAGVNGLTHEALLAVLIDRLEGFQAGAFACLENQLASGHLRAAIETLKGRTKLREQRGVEGTHTP